MGISSNKKIKKNKHLQKEVNENQSEDLKIIKFDTDKSLHKIFPSICKIIIPDKDQVKIGIGFLIKLFRNDIPFFCLMTNEHFINRELIEANKEIEINYSNGTKKKKIILNEYERYIGEYNNIDLDISIVEILDKDNINKDYFLLPNLDLDYKNLDDLKEKEIFIPQYPKGGDLDISEGKILGIEKYIIIHNVSSIDNLSGSPILLKNTSKVIGILRQIDKNKKENYGNFIYPIINILKNRILYYKAHYEGEYFNDKFEGKGKYIYENGEYYEGDWKNGLRNGNGKIYKKDGLIRYEGGFINDKYEGGGQYFWQNNELYIGEFKNGLRNGKGKELYQNGKVKYEGDYVDDKYEGNGKYLWENGEYYKGQWKNDLKNGKGSEYYKNGNLKYEGDWVNDKFEGKGKYIWENCAYYIGDYKNGLKNGKGKFYYKNGDLKYDGDFVNGKFEGKGKYIFENGEYYEGEWKNNLKNGKGKIFDKDGNMIYKGKFIDDKCVDKKK